jgi:hypothetical protein
MALVQMATQSWGWVTDTQGNAQPSATVSIKNLDGTNATHYADVAGTSPLTSSLTTSADGTVPRFIDGGPYTMAVNGGTARRIDAVPGAAATDITDRGLNAGIPYGAFAAAARDGLTDQSTGLQARIDALNTAGGGILYFPKGTYRVDTTLQVKSNVILAGAGKDLVTIDATNVAVSEGTHYYGLQAKGTVGTPTLLTVDAKRGDMQATVASTTGLATGDWVVLGSQGPRGTLNTTITSGSTTIIVDLTSGAAAFSARGYLAIGNEQIGYSSVSVAGSQYTFTIRAGTLGRGAQGTTAAAATAGAAVTEFNSGKFILWRPTCIDRGEIKRVSSVSGSVVTFEQPLNDDYPVGNASFVREVTPVQNFAVRDLTVKQNPSIVAHIEWSMGFEYCDNFSVEGCGLTNASHINIGLNMCTRFLIARNTIYGKGISDPGGTHAFYGIATYNACQWGRVEGNHAERAFKLFTCSSNTAGQGWWGQPRDITVVGNTLDNSGVGFFSRHPAYEVHGSGERIAITGNIGHGAESIVSIQTAGHVNVANNVGSGWYRAGLIFSGAHELHGISVTGNDWGSRTVGPGRTTVTVDPGSGGTTVTVTDTSSFIDDNSSAISQLIQIDSEIILFTGYTSTTFTGCTRGYMGTTAAAHSIGAVVTPMGSAAACPIDLDLTDCVWGQRAYNQPVTALTVDPGTAGTTFTVLDTTGFPAATASAPQLAVVEGANSARNFEPEVISYTGSTGTTLTGVTRALEGTPATAHAIGIFVMPYEIPVTQLKIAENMAEQDLPYYGMAVRGYTPTRQVTIERNQILYSGAVKPTNEGVRVEAHTAKLRLNEIYGYPSAYRGLGNQIIFRGNEAEMSVPEQSTGYMVRVEGTDCRVLENQGRGTAYGVQIGAASLRTVVKGNVWEVPNAGRGVLSADATTVCRDNLFARFTDGSTTDLAVTAAATLTLPTHGNYVWRVAGATGITAITAQADGTVVVLRFTSAITVTDNGTTLNLAGNFAPAAANGVLTLVCDGTNWRETARAVN